MIRFFQFRLRTLFGLTTLAAVLCVAGPWAAEQYRWYRLQQLLPVFT